MNRNGWQPLSCRRATALLLGCNPGGTVELNASSQFWDEAFFILERRLEDVFPSNNASPGETANQPPPPLLMAEGGGFPTKITAYFRKEDFLW